MSTYNIYGFYWILEKNYPSVFIKYASLHNSSEYFGVLDERNYGPEVIKRFFMLNSTEHEISSAYKYENANNSWYIYIY